MDFIAKHLIAILLLFELCDCLLFRKIMTLDDPDVSILFQTLSDPPPMALKSLVECAGYAGYALSLANRSMRASAFKYVNGSCTLGRTPIFDDQVFAKSTVSDGSDGIHALVGVKPTVAEALEDMLAYFLFNEQDVYTQPWTPGLTGVGLNYNVANPAGSPPIVSPVQTLEGEFAILAPIIKFTQTVKSYANLTVMMWYYSISTTNTQEPLFGVYSTSGGANANYLVFLGWGTAGNLELRCKISGSYENGVSAASVVPTKVWAYIGFTYSANGAYSLYVNGTVQQTGSFTNGGLIPLIDMLEMGADGNNIPGYSYIASLEMYGRAMSQAEVQDAMQKSTTSRTLLV